MEPTQPSSGAAIPIAIVVGFTLIAAAIFFTGGKSAPAPVQNAPEATESTTVANVRPIDATDYVRGNPNAPIVMIEYSDYDCPFCKQFHTTMNQIMEEFGVDGKIAWVYRQYPLAQLHPNAPRVAEAAFCVGELGGNNAFWQFTDLIFEQRELDEPTNTVRLPDYAERVGVDLPAYNACVSSGRHQASVTKSAEEAFNLGARGTPYTILIAGDQQAVINGAQSYDTIRGILTNLVNQLDGTFEAVEPVPATAPVSPTS